MSLKEHALIIYLFIWNPQSSLSPTSGPEENRAVTEGIRVLGEFISRKQTNLSALTSIVEVKVETALVSEEKQGNFILDFKLSLCSEYCMLSSG